MQKMSLVEAVRKRPGMYFGSPADGSGTNHIILELVGNGIDQFLAGDARAIAVTITPDQITVRDDGPGLPFDQPSRHLAGKSLAEEFLEQTHRTPTANSQAPHVHAATWGIGLAPVNAICDELVIVSRNGAQEWRHRYERGRSLARPVLSQTSCQAGSVFQLRLAKCMAPPDIDALRAVFWDQAHLYPDVSLSLNGESFHAGEGLRDVLRQIHVGSNARIMWRRDTIDRFRLDVALAHGETGPLSIRSWVNGAACDRGGSHVTALELALDDLGLQPSAACFHLIMEQPQYAGPSMDKLHTPELIARLRNALVQLLG